MTRQYQIVDWRRNSTVTREDALAIEEPLAIHLDGKPFATLMRTPGQDCDLALGFLFSEGIIESKACVQAIHFETGEARAQLAASARLRVPWARSVQVSSSCGVCGRAMISELVERLPSVEPWDPGPEFFIGCLAALPDAQPGFARTGGSHAAILLNHSGTPLASAEDVGRHNAVDKLVGSALASDRVPLRRTALLLTSRASFDIVQKAAMAGIPAVAALGAASTLAVELAQAARLKLYWFVRPDRAVSSAIFSS
jgi:FdhD protein